MLDKDSSELKTLADVLINSIVREACGFSKKYNHHYHKKREIIDLWKCFQILGFCLICDI